MEEIQPLTEELIKQIGERSEVKQYDYLREASIAVENFKPYRFSRQEDDDNVMIVGHAFLDPFSRNQSLKAARL